MRVATKNGYEDIVYVMYKVNAGDKRFLENDEMYFEGTVYGLVTYTTIMGGSVTLPGIEATKATLYTEDMKSEAIGIGESSFPVELFSWETRYYNYAAISILNNSNVTMDFRVKVIFRDSDGGIIGIGNASEDYIGAGDEVLIKVHNDEKFTTFDYEIEYTEYTGSRKPTAKDITIQTHDSKNKVIIEAKNNGKYIARYPEYNILFFYNGRVVASDSGYLTDGDYELKPGKTEMREVKTSENFDSYRIWLTGYAQ